ncbi:MAG: putative sugar nucleotidyl transferase [Candidatus Margulisiibacteriota bacterium]
MNLTIIEDEGYKKLLPLTWLRPVWDLRCGATTILEKLKRKYPDAEFTFKSRGSQVTGQEINGRLLPSGREIKYPWDLIKYLKEDLEEDLKVLGAGIKGEVHPTAVIHNPEQVLIEKGAVIDAHAVLDARQGPIFIGAGTIVHPHSLLRGPLSIGRHCKVAGEIVHSVLLDYVNKGHYGFIGHSYICSWVNLGAGTTNSNLKNNYGGVKVQVEGKPVDSGETFLGCFIGDHTKTAIGTLLYTGCVIGVAANLFGQPYYKKSVPSFSWGGGKEAARIEETIEIARAAMKRRGLELSAADIQLLKKVYTITKTER